MRLQKEVMKTPEFTKWANDNVILVELDFPRRTPQAPEIQKQNMELQQTFAVQGFPTVWFVKPQIKEEGKINLEQLGSSGYLAGGPTVWIKSANEILKNFVADPKPVKAKKS
jgi:protein disulfide-isomerase